MKTRRKKLFWQLYPSLLIISLATLLALLVITQYTFRDFFYRQTGDSLKEKALILRSEFIPHLLSKNYQELQRKTVLISQKANNRISIILTDGKVVADSSMSPVLLENQTSRPEVIQALKGTVGQSMRHSPTLDENFVYIAAPIYKGKQIIAILRNSVPLDSLKKNLSGITFQIMWVGLFLIIVLGAINWWISQKISRPLEQIKNYADKFTEGSFQAIPLGEEKHSVEIESLALAFNKMGKRINKQFKKIFNQKEEREAVFNSMVEGVLSVNFEGEIFHWNRSACEFFDVDINKLNKGIPLIEAFKNETLVELFEKSNSQQTVLEEEIVLVNNKVLQVHGTPLYSSKSKKMGVLFVFDDITKLRQLETHRKEFVANVSHELRTPLTAIQGFIETLIDEELDKETRGKFLGIVQRHANRLRQIIEDLLALSNVERDSEQTSIEFNPGSLDQLIASSIDNCERKAKAKNIELAGHVEDKSLEYPLNSQLMEQALTNLIDNAIKYSPENTKIDVDLSASDSGISIKVKDEGPGIAPEHHERLFERFYSVDKARSREMGGSGLGLSIVKHIVRAHGGDIGVMSEMGKGTTFVISLPT
jgi:two-component system phosphate regulon sensor histidine kinase PhoR